jgi:hypothetical protein
MSQTFGGSQVGLNPYLLNIIPLQNIANPDQLNGNGTNTLSNSVRLVNTMINPATRTLRTSNILPFTNGGTVNMIGRFNVTGQMNVSGNFNVNSPTTNIYTSNYLHLHAVSTSILLNSTSATTSGSSATPAISFITASNRSFSLDSANRALYKGDGQTSNVNYMWISSAILHADRAAVNLGGVSTMSTIFDVWNGDAYFDQSIFVKNNVNCAQVLTYSDRNIKSNIVPVQNALETVSKLNGVHYDIQGKQTYGFIAQEVAQIIPEAVQKTPSGILALDYSQIIPFLTEAIKELNTKLDRICQA